MAQIQMDDQVFKAAQRRAADGGYSSVDEYVADIVAHDLVEDNPAQTPNLDHLFTPHRLAEIDEAAEQVREHFKQKREAWIQKNGER